MHQPRGKMKMMIPIMMISVLVAIAMLSLAPGLVQSVYASSSSTDESEGINDEIMTFDVDCPEGYELDDSGSTCIPSSAQDEKVTKTTWDECVDMYDVFICAQLEDTLYKQSGETFNHTKPSKAELPSYEENPYFWDCVEDYKEEYDKSESISRDLCKDLLK